MNVYKNIIQREARAYWFIIIGVVLLILVMFVSVSLVRGKHEREIEALKAELDDCRNGLELAIKTSDKMMSVEGSKLGECENALSYCQQRSCVSDDEVAEILEPKVNR